MEIKMNNELIFKEAADYADKFSTCRKVHVGACFIDEKGNKYFSCNNGGSSNCNELGYCYKAKVTGIYKSTEKTRKYCQSVHAEVNMIKTLAKNNIDPSKGTLFVTRYMCEGCTKACLNAGIRKFVYCGRVSVAENSKNVERWCSDVGATIEWHPEYDFEFNKN